jgi:site-specific DNA recombinase
LSRSNRRALLAELASLSAQFADQTTYLRLAETLSAFLGRLHENVHTLDVAQQQRIVRLAVKEVVVGHDSITIRHSIPTIARSFGSSGDPSAPQWTSGNNGPTTSYALCTWGDLTGIG